MVTSTDDEAAKRRARNDRDRSSNKSRSDRDGHRSSSGRHSNSSEKTRTSRTRSGTSTPGAYSARSSERESRISGSSEVAIGIKLGREGRGDSVTNTPRSTTRKRSPASSIRKSPIRSPRSSPKAPGAHSSTHRPSSGKELMRSPDISKGSKKIPLPFPDKEQPSSGEEIVAEAILVEDDDSADEKKQKSKSRRQEQEEKDNREAVRLVQQENELLRKKREQDNERRRLELEGIQQRKQREENKRNRQICMIVVVVLVLIGGGVGAYFGVSASSSDDSSTTLQEPVAATTDDPNPDPTLAPVAPDNGNAPIVPATPIPSLAPSDAPTETLKYPPPNVQDCQKVAIGLPREDADNTLTPSNYQATLELESSSSDMTPLLNAMETQMQRILMSELVGCNDIAERRSLRQRKLQGDFRFVIFNAKVASLQVDESKTCSADSDAILNCSVVQVKLDLLLQGQEPVFRITGMITDVFDTSKEDVNLALKLELPQPQYQSLSLSQVLALDPTAAPSKSPTGLPSATPTTGSPSSSPTVMPVVNPTDPPTLFPTIAPTNPPTVRPTPNPTPQPTESPVNDNAECEDIESYFEGGEYDEYVGGNDASYILQCDDLIGTNVIGFSVTQDGCGFTCVADKKPKDFEPKCGGAPAGTTVEITLKGKFEGERIFIGIQADGVPKLPCENPFLVEVEDY